MLEKKIKYTDYNGNEREETFYFYLSQAELVEMNLSTDGGMDTYIKRITEEQDVKKIMEIFKSLICKSYGKKSDDGKRFVKSPELTKEFTETEAYSDLFVELSTDAKKAAAFVKGILPSKIQSEIDKQGLPENLPK